MSVGFAHYEEPIRPEGPLGMEAGSLIEQVGHQPKPPNKDEIFEFYNLFDNIKALKPNSWGGPALEQARELSTGEDRYRREYLSEQVAREAYSDSVYPFEARSIAGGAADAYNTIGAALLRSFDAETADWMVRHVGLGAKGRDAAMAMDGGKDGFGTRRWFNENLYGASKSIASAAILAGAAAATGGSAPAFMAIGFSATEAHSSYVDAMDSGKLTHDQAFDYAWKKGAIEGGVMAIFNTLGWSGLEKQWFGRQFSKALIKEFGYGFLAELPEEEITEMLHMVHEHASGMGEMGRNSDLWKGDDGEFMSSPAWRRLRDTFNMTFFTMGGMTGSKGVTDKAMSAMFNPGRRAMNELKQVAPELHEDLEERHGNLKKKSNRDAAGLELFDAYMKRLDDSDRLDGEISWWEEVAKDADRRAEQRDVAEAVVAKLRGTEEWLAKPSGDVLSGLMGERRSAWLPEATIGLRRAPKEAAERKAEVPKAILKMDPDARIVNPLDTLSTDPNLQDEHAELVRVLQGVQELATEARGGREIFFVDTQSGVKGQYTSDGIYVTMPSLQRNMKDGTLDTEGLRAAVAGTFAHEWSHELKELDGDLWQEMYDALAKDDKYKLVIEEGAAKFQELFESYAGQKVDPYSHLRGEAAKTKLDELRTEESLAYLMDKHFISTGLVSKMAKRNRSTLENLRDWLKRVRNSLFGDKLYLQMVDVFNKVGETYKMEPLPTPAPEKKTRKRKKPKNNQPSVDEESDAKWHEDNRRSKDLTRGLPEWAEGPVLKLETRGTVVLEKHHASEHSVVVTTKTKKGAVKIVLLMPEDPKKQTIPVKREEDLEGLLDEALLTAQTNDAMAEGQDRHLGPLPDAGRTDSFTDAVNEDITSFFDELRGNQPLGDMMSDLYEGLRHGLTDEQGTISPTDINEFSERLAVKGDVDDNGPFLTKEDVDDLRVQELKDRNLVLEVDGKLRLTDFGRRVMSWSGGKDEVGERFSLDPDYDYGPSIDYDHLPAGGSSSPSVWRAMEIGLMNAGAESRADLEKAETEIRKGYVTDLWLYRKQHIDDSDLEKSILDEMLSLHEVSVEEARTPVLGVKYVLPSDTEAPPREAVITEFIDVKYVKFDEGLEPFEGNPLPTATIGPLYPDPEAEEGEKGRWRFSLMTPEEARLDTRAYPSALEAKKRSMRRARLESVTNVRRLLGLGEVEGLTDDDVAAMESAYKSAEVGLRGSPYEGKTKDLIEQVWGFDHSGLALKWLRENRPNALRRVVESVWSDHHKPTIKKVGGEKAGVKLLHFINREKKALITGKGVSKDTSKIPWRLAARVRAALPSPVEYEQASETQDRFSLEIHKLQLTDEYWSGKSKKYVDQRTRSLVDMVEAHQYLRTPPEVRLRVEEEVNMQIRFGKDPAGETRRLMERGLKGGVFNSQDIILSELAHKRILSLIDEGSRTAEELEGLLQQKMWLAMISNEAHSEWGRVGAFMRDRVETVRERGLRTIDKALYAPNERLRRRIAVWRYKAMSGSDADRMKATKKLAELRAEQAAEAVRVEAVLESKGWDLSQMDKYLANREALEAYVYDIKKAKGQVGTVEQILYEIFVNNILSGPLTQTVNVASNMAYAFWEYGPKRFTHAITNEVLLASGMKAGDPMAPRVGEFKYLFKGTQTAFLDACRHFGRSIWFENESFEMSLGVKGSETRAKMEAGRAKHIGGPGSWNRGVLGKAEFLTGRAIRLLGTTSLTALDSFQKCLNAHCEIVALTYREARQGVRMPDGSTRKLEGDEIGEYIDSVLRDKSHHAWGVALDRARDSVFQGDPSRLASAALHARRTVPGVKWLLPFVLTPDNLLRKGVNYSPLGMATFVHGGYQILMDGETDHPMVEQFVNQLAVWTLLVWMCEFDDEEPPRITGTVPDQPQEWAGARRGQTIPPMSFRTTQNEDGSWNYVPYGRVEPFSTVLALCCDMRTAWKKGSVDYSVKRVAESLVEITKDKTFLKVVGDVGKIMKAPTKGFFQLAGSYVTAAVPNSYKQVQRARRKYEVDRRTWGAEVVEKDEDAARAEDMGFMSAANWDMTSDWVEMWGRNKLRSMELGIYEDYEKYDARGNKIPTGHYPYGGQQTSFLYNLFIPFRAKNVHEGVGDKTLRRYNEQNPNERLGVSEPDPFWVIDGETRYLDKPEYQEYTRLAGKINDRLVDSEAVDIEKPTKQDVQSLWRDNFNRSQRAAQEIMLKREAGLPVEEDLNKIAESIYNNKTKKHLNILSRKEPVLKDLFMDLGMDDVFEGRKRWNSLSRPERRNALENLKLKQYKEQEVSYQWLHRQGINPESLRGRRKELGMGKGYNFGRALNTMRDIKRRGENAGQRTVSPRAKASR